MKFLIELRKFQKIHSKTIQRQLQISMIKKYLKKDIYLQKKDRKLLMIRYEHNGIIIKYQTNKLIRQYTKQNIG